MQGGYLEHVYRHAASVLFGVGFTLPPATGMRMALCGPLCAGRLTPTTHYCRLLSAGGSGGRGVCCKAIQRLAGSLPDR